MILDNRQPPPIITRPALIAGAALLTFVVVFLCLIPKPENDLFFELRIGTDILRTHHLPRVDTYSWTNRGTRWDVPEWLSFIIYALAYQHAGFFGVWLVVVACTLGTAWFVWWWLARRLGFAWGFLLTNVMLLALSDYIQERPYAYTYLLLPISLALLVRAGEGRPKLLFWLPLECVVWTNLHQGVVVLLCILVAYALADTIFRPKSTSDVPGRFPQDSGSGGRISSAPPLLGAGGHQPVRSPQNWGLGGRSSSTGGDSRALWATILACALAVMASPYGWRVYWNVFITLRDPVMMSHVTEWRPITVVPFAQMQAFLLIAVLTISALLLSRRRPGTVQDALVLGALLIESVLHARNIALFAIAAVVIGRPHFEAAAYRLRQSIGGAPAGRSSLAKSLAYVFVGALYLLMLAAVSLASLRPAIGARGYSPEGIGEAAAREPSYPSAACDFIDRERFPPHLRLFNNFALGGYLMWRLPSEPDFVDGRLDVFTGRTFDDTLAMENHCGSPKWVAFEQAYNLDCVITTTPRIARAFAKQPDWAVVYVDPVRKHHARCVILLRRRPHFAELIRRCRKDNDLNSGRQTL